MMADLNGQVATAVAQHVDYVTILMGANDARTSTVGTMTPVGMYQSQFLAAMNTLSAGLPNARIFIASVPDVYTLWNILHTNSSAVRIWARYSICQSLLANPTSTR